METPQFLEAAGGILTNFQVAGATLTGFKSEMINRELVCIGGNRKFGFVCLPQSQNNCFKIGI
jgi:hypothetical protein